MGRPKKIKWVKPVNPAAIKVGVTAEDIKKGKPRDEQNCPVALATNRAFGNLLEGCLSIQQSFASLRVPGEASERTTQLPDEAVQFIRDFDGSADVKPFEFYLDPTRLQIPGQTQKKGAQEEKIEENKETDIDTTSPLV